MQLFTFKKVDSPRLLKESFQVRFQVYCRERNFIKDEDYPDQYETDEYDKFSLHFVALDSAENVVGSVRLILPHVGMFPIEQRCQNLAINWNIIGRDKSIEVSRLAISKLFRRRTGKGTYYEPTSGSSFSEREGDSDFLMRVRPLALGLYREMYRESKKRGIRYWFALMEEKLWVLTKMHGIVFRPIGEEVEFHGAVRPYVADLLEIEKNMYEKFSLS